MNEKTVEAVARAIYESDMKEQFAPGEPYHSWESLLRIEPQQYEIREYRSRSRAAIAAYEAALARGGYGDPPTRADAADDQSWR